MRGCLSFNFLDIPNDPCLAFFEQYTNSCVFCPCLTSMLKILCKGHTMHFPTLGNGSEVIFERQVLYIDSHNLLTSDM